MSETSQEQDLATPIERDWFLQLLISIVNSSGKDGSKPISIAMTVTVGGTVISGHFIEYKEYFRRYGETFGGALTRDGMDAAGAAKLAKDIANLGVVEDARVKNVDPDDLAQHMHYLHMGDARVVTPGGMLPGGLWRCRVSAVDAFMLGEFAKSA